MGLLGGHNEVQDAAQSQKVAAWAAKELVSKPEVTAETLELVEVVSHHQQVRPRARSWIVPRPDAQLRPASPAAHCNMLLVQMSKAPSLSCSACPVALGVSMASHSAVSQCWPLHRFADEQRAQ